MLPQSKKQKLLQKPYNYSLDATLGKTIATIVINIKIPILAEDHREINAGTVIINRTAVMDTITITIILADNLDHAMITIIRITIATITTIIIIVETIMTIIVTMANVIGIDLNVHVMNT